MWTKLESQKNHFLQKQLQHLTPNTINEMIINGLDKNYSNHNKYNVLSEIPCKSSQYLQDRAQLAYGDWALPKLIKEMASNNAETQFRAINSLSEYVSNPLHVQRAITEFQIVRRCQNIFLRIRMKYQKSKDREVDRLLVIFYYIAKHMNGVNEIVTRKRLMDQFYIIVRDREKHLIKTCKILSLLTEHIEATDYLVNIYKVVNKLLDIWSREICLPSYPDGLWLHLQHILTRAPEAVDLEFFDILYTRIKGRLFQYHCFDLKCFGLLLRANEEAQKRFLAIDGVKDMYEILKNEEVDTYENVIFTLMTAVIGKPILWRCREFVDLPKIIVKLAGAQQNSRMQLMCLQLLRQMGVMPCIKHYIKENCLAQLKEIECLSSANKKCLNEILYWLQREIYHTTELRKEPIFN